MLKHLIIAASLTALPLLLLPSAVSAVDVVSNKSICNGGAAKSTVCTDKKVGDNNPISGSRGVLKSVINLLTIVVAIAAVIMIILGGLKFITSGSNPEDVKNARERIIYALVALLIAALAQVVVRLILGVVKT